MSKPGTVRRRSPRASAANAYRMSFVTRVHTLVAVGYARLDPQDLASREETEITGMLVDAIDEYLQSTQAPTWAHRFAVHDDRPLTSMGKLGKSRPRVDIELERTQRGPRPSFQFEAKRLYASGSVAAYVGDDGLGCFTSGRYAADHATAGMLGYVQSETVSAWTAKVEKGIRKAKKKLRIIDKCACWTSVKLTGHASYRSAHRRNPTPITVYHTFLKCC